MISFGVETREMYTIVHRLAWRQGVKVAEKVGSDRSCAFSVQAIRLFTRRMSESKSQRRRRTPFICTEPPWSRDLCPFARTMCGEQDDDMGNQRPTKSISVLLR